MSLQRMVLKTSSLANIRSTTWPFLVLLVWHAEMCMLCVWGMRQLRRLVTREKCYNPSKVGTSPYTLAAPLQRILSLPIPLLLSNSGESPMNPETLQKGVELETLLLGDLHMCTRLRRVGTLTRSGNCRPGNCRPTR